MPMEAIIWSRRLRGCDLSSLPLVNASRSRALALALASVGPRCLLNGAAIDVENALSSFNKKQLHHIWPRNHLKKTKAEDDNLLVNICLLPAAANLKISDQDPNKYLPELQVVLGANADDVFASNVMPRPSQFDYSKRPTPSSWRPASSCSAIG